MAINSAQQAEILRKAKANIALTNPTSATTALYNSYKPSPVAAPVKPAAGTPDSAQAYINGSDKYGGLSGYTNTQQGRYNDALASGNTDLITRLKADSARVGYALNDQRAVNDTTNQPQGPDINGMYDNYYNAALGKLRAARETQLAGLAGQDDLIKQTGYDNRNSNDVMAAQALQRVREQQANQGINGGDSVTAQLSNNTDRQNGANAINTNEGNQLKQLMAMRNAINNNASAEELALLQQNQGDRAGALLGQYNTDRQFGLQEGGLTGNYNGQRTLQGQQFDFQKSTDERNFGYTQARDAILDQRYQKQFEEDTRRFGLTYALQQAQLNHQISNDAAQRSISWYNAKTSRQSSEWSQDPNNPDNQYKQLQLKKLQEEIDGNGGYTPEMKSSLSDLSTALSSGNTNPYAAQQEITKQAGLGLITPAQASQMKSFIQKYLEGGAAPQPQAVDPSLLQKNGDQLEAAWSTDPSGKAAGRAKLDWRRWIQDPQGYRAGLSYEMWKSQYGPTLGG